MKPFEVALKTWKTETDPDKMGFLPYGLKQVVKKNIDFNQFVLKDFEEITERDMSTNTEFSNLEGEDKNNLISILKPAEGRHGLKVAICICMYSEDKTMLRKTLTGVGKNIAAFNRKGIPSH